MKVLDVRVTNGQPFDQNRLPFTRAIPNLELIVGDDLVNGPNTKLVVPYRPE